MSARSWEIMRAVKFAIDASPILTFEGEDGNTYEVATTRYDHNSVTIRVKDENGYEQTAHRIILRAEGLS